MTSLRVQIKDGERTTSDQLLPFTPESAFSYGGERVRVSLKNRVLRVINSTSNAEIFTIDLSDPKSYHFKADLLNVPHVRPVAATSKSLPPPDGKKKKRKAEAISTTTPPPPLAEGEPKKKKARVVAAFNKLLETAKIASAAPGLELSEEGEEK